MDSFKKEFDEQLTCPVCLQKYANPKALPCNHAFCLQCIQHLQGQTQERQHYIKCPICRVRHPIPEGGVINLPNAFQINGLLELERKITVLENKQQVCSKHNNNPLEVYCKTCRQGICQDCTISEEHNAHKLYPVSECYPKSHQQLQDNLELVNHKRAAIGNAVKHLAAREAEMQQHGQQLKEQIDQHAQKFIDQIEESRTQLSRQVDNMVQQKTEVVAAQKQQAQKVHNQLKNCQEMIEHYLKEWTKLQILIEKQTLIDEMNMTAQNVDPAVFQPIEKADINFKETNDIVTKKLGIVTGTVYGKATLTTLPCCIAKQQSTATLTLKSREGSQFSLPSSLISSTLSSSDRNFVKCHITYRPNIYNIMFTPSTRGEHLLTVQVGGVNIPNSPFSLPVFPSPKLRGKPLKTITRLNTPVGIAACDNGNIVVAEYARDCIRILDKHGSDVSRFGTTGTKEGQFMFPRGVAISIDKHILVTDNHRLQKLTTDNGVCIKSVGSCDKGKRQLEFNGPGGIAVHPTTGQIFVADCDNNRIQVFTSDLSFSQTITHKQLKQPGDVALDSNGYLYISGCANHCITKFTTRGKYIQSFVTLEGSWYSRFRNGTHFAFLTIHNDLVYVSEYRYNRVSIFDNSGQLLHSFGTTGSGQGEVKEPSGISVDNLGNLYVCDTGNGRVVVY